MSRYLHHVTLTTGDTRRSWAHEIDPAIMPRLRELIAQAREPGGAVIPHMDGLRLLITDTRRCALCSVVTDDDVPVLRFAVADHQRCGAQLWRMLIETAATPCRFGPQDRPETPWCATRLDPGITLLPEAGVGALGDLERCIAWAWLDDPDRR